MMKPTNAKVVKDIKEPNSYLNKKGTPGSDSDYIFNRLPPGQDIGQQDLAVDVSAIADLGIEQPELSSTENAG